ncbi:MAG TPA: hypothetical protein DCE42_25250 [Myxococcales bacterium]|nr:hypothetical protein [Myxococcales bacterium]
MKKIHLSPSFLAGLAFAVSLMIGLPTMQSGCSAPQQTDGQKQHDGVVVHTQDAGPGDASPYSQPDAIAPPKTPYKPDPTLPPLPDVPCPPDVDSFRDNLWEPILSTKCMSCHNAQGAAKGSGFVLRPPSEQDFLSKNLQITAATALKLEGGTSSLIARATATHMDGHPGGAVIRPGSSEYEAFALFVKKLQGDVKDCKETTTCDLSQPGYRRLRRLTRDEFDNSVRDLFGFPSTWGSTFVKDVVVNGFDNNASALVVTPLLADQIRKASEEIASKALSDAKHIVPCNVASGNRDCAMRFVRDFGRKMFRRPVSQATITRYLKVFDLGAKVDFAEGIKLLISAMVQSPYFLYRQELGVRDAAGFYQLTPYEIASELSYFFWGSTPDDTLLKAAADGTLKTQEQIYAQAKRLLDSPKSNFLLERFFIQWLDADRILHTPKDQKLYPGFTEAIRNAMLEETKRFVRHVFRDGEGTLTELLTAKYSIMNKALAQFYKVSAPTKTDASGYGLVSFGQNERGGLLSLGAVLATHARPNDSSPVHRGLLVREKLLCQHLPPPPANVDTTPPGLDPTLTTRERYSEHAKNPVCSGCHKMIDPIGFGFESFDGIGLLRTEQNGHPIDNKGEIINSPNTSGTFTGVRELATKLVQSADVQQCVSVQYMRWAYGTKENDKLLCLLGAVQQRFVGQKLKLRELFFGLTQTIHFRARISKDFPPNPPKPDGAASEPPSADAGVVEMPAEQEPPEQTQVPEPPPVNSLIKVEIKTQSKWETGYCNQIFVTNDGKVDADWSIRVKVDGKVKQLWNAVSQPSGAGYLQFSGVHWNKTLKPGQTINFGFCADL